MQIIFTDNASTDRTKEIASSYPEVVEIIDETENDHNQTKWVTKMARMACKLNPDWIVHLDADELWGGFANLRHVEAAVAGCERMYLHPPISQEFDFLQMKYYLDFDHIPIPQECKVAHRPDPEITITHGNHGVEGNQNVEYTQEVIRHHYPIRSYRQWERKCRGHEALHRRGNYCERWKLWYDWLRAGTLEQHYVNLTSCWKKMIQTPEVLDFQKLISFWATEDMIEFFNNQNYLPRIGKWPNKNINIRKSHEEQSSPD